VRVMPLSPEQEALCRRLEEVDQSDAARLIRQLAHETDDLCDRLNRSYLLVREHT